MLVLLGGVKIICYGICFPCLKVCCVSVDNKLQAAFRARDISESIQPGSDIHSTGRHSSERAAPSVHFRLCISV
jgi:hypothetical protein